MVASYHPWLVALSVLVAAVVSFTALTLAGRVAADQSARRLWLFGGAIAMGIGIWSMHFIGMLAYSVPIALTYAISVTFASLLIAVLTSGFALLIASGAHLSSLRLLSSAMVMGAGIAAMHYTGMAAIKIVPAIAYDPLLVAASVAIAVSASWAALWLAFRLRSGRSWALMRARMGAALIMGLAIAGMHYTGMAAARLAPDAYCLGGAALDNRWLGVIIGVVAIALLAITLIAAIYDAHLKSRERRDAERLARLNEDLQHGRHVLMLATQAAGIACWEYDVVAGRLVWSENEIEALRAAGIAMGDMAALFAVVHPQDQITAQAIVAEAWATGRPTCAVRVRLQAGGQLHHVQVHARLIGDTQGELQRLLGVCWDVTSDVGQVERERALQLQLREVSRRAGMAEVAAGMLHNVGNVLNSLGVSARVLDACLRDSRVANVGRVAAMILDNRGRLADFLTNDERGREIPAYLPLLAQGLADENRALQAEARAVVGHVEHISAIISAQQCYAIRGGLAEDVDVAALLDTAVLINLPEYMEVPVVRRYEALPPLQLDRHKLLQIVNNLLGNARHAIRDQVGGQRLLELDLRVEDGLWLVLEVRDSGIGMDAQTLARLFEFGHTTKRDGHGFGLHASANLAKEMGGQLRGHSDGLGKGACFTLRLPLVAGAAEQRLQA